MRRIIAFIVMAITLVVIALISFPGIQDGMNLGIEFKGGVEILYEVKPKEGANQADFDKNFDAIIASAAETIARRVDISGVKNPIITIEDSNIRVTVSGTTNQTASIQSLIESDAEISFRDVNDKNLVPEGSELLKENGALLDYDNGKPVIRLNIANPQLFGQITQSISQYPQGENKIVIWLGFDEEKDSYKEAQNAGNEAIRSKIISDAYVNEMIQSDSAIISGSFTPESAKVMADLIRAGTLDFKLESISTNTIGATYGREAFNSSMMAGVIGLIAVCVLMITFYGLSGVVSSLSLFVYILVTLFFFNFLKGEYGPDTIAATVIGVGMAVDANIISFERTKDELLKGRSVRKAYEEGNKKSLSTILDANLTTLIAAGSLYLFGTRTVKGFATMLIVSIFFTMIIMVGFSKLLLSFLAQSERLQKYPHFFGVRKKDIPDVKKGETQKYYGIFAKTNFLKHAKKWVVGTLVIFIIGVAAGVTFQITTGEPLNLGLQFSSGSKITINSTGQDFDTEEEIRNLFANNEELYTQPDLITFGVRTNEEGEEFNVAMLSFKTSLAHDELTFLTQYFVDYGKEHPTYITEYTQTNVSPIVAQKTVENALLAVLIASFFIVLYVTIRFKITYALAAIIALIHDVALTIGIFALFRFEVNLEFVSAILAIIGYSINDTIVSFDRLRENIAESNKPSLTMDDKRELINKSLQQTVARSLMTTASTLITVLALFLFGAEASRNFNIAMLFGLIFGTYSSIYIAPLTWLWLEKKFGWRLTERKRKASRDIIIGDEPDEHVIFGIND